MKLKNSNFKLKFQLSESGALYTLFSKHCVLQKTSRLNLSSSKLELLTAFLMEIRHLLAAELVTQLRPSCDKVTMCVKNREPVLVSKLPASDSSRASLMH